MSSLKVHFLAVFLLMLSTMYADAWRRRRRACYHCGKKRDVVQHVDRMCKLFYSFVISFNKAIISIW